MYVNLLISMLLLSHILADFCWQTDNLVKKKKESYKGLLWHSSHFLISALFLTILFIDYYLVITILVITVTHFIIDKAKISLDKGKSHLSSFYIFIMDQSLHIIIILISYPFLYDIKPNHFLNSLLEKLLSAYPFLELINNPNLLSYIILVIAGLLFSIKGGTVLSLLIIKLPKEKIEATNDNSDYLPGVQATAATIEEGSKTDDVSESEKEGIKRYGKVIGNIERVIIILAILINQYSIIAVIIAIKSIGRFKELDNKTSDYYIIGNFASLSVSLFIGITLIFTKKLLLE